MSVNGFPTSEKEHAMTASNAAEPKRSQEEPEDAAFRLLRDALRGLQFGSVTAIVQNGVVVQVDRTEKKRIAQRRQTD
jgi:hypothetical protein